MPILYSTSNILGTTTYTSLSSGGVGSGYGSVYELVFNSTTGTYTFNNLYSFTGGSDGANPYAGLSIYADNIGNYYGTASSGGISNNGVVFKVTNSSGTYSCCSSLYRFTGGSTDGANPYGGVTFYNSYLYGAAAVGGSSSFRGLVYKINPSSGAESILYTFTGPDGSYPRGGIVADQYGNLYGTASSYGSGSTSGQGNAFHLNPTDPYLFSSMHNFSGTSGDGSKPWSTLVKDAAGNFYGTTTSGGAYGYGLVFKLIAGTGGSFTYQSLYSFTGGSDGANPYAGLTMDPNGALYGTTVSGGSNGKGTVFKITQ